MLFSVKGFPVEPMTRAPACRQRLGQRDIGGDDDVVGLDVIDDPVVGCVEPIVHDFEGEPFLIRGSHPRVGDQGHVETIPSGDAVDLLFDRTRIGIYKNVQQTKSPAFNRTAF